MKTFYGIGIAAVVLTIMPVAPTAAQATADDGPSWSQQLRCDADGHCPRFTVLPKFDNAAVLDNETGLVWEQSPSPDVFTWGRARLRCNQLATGGRAGWRLPTVQELGSLVDPAVSVPISLPPGHPFANVVPFLYWSATTLSGFSDAAWFMRFDDRTDRANNIAQSAPLNVWCVRGGQGTDVQ